MPKLVIVPSGFGEIAAPSGFVWPTAEDYCRKTADSLVGVASEKIFNMAGIDFPMSADVEQVVLTNTTDIFQNTMGTILEAGSAISLEDIAASTPGKVATSVVSGFTTIATDAFSGDGIDVGSTVTTAITTLAQVASTFSDIPLIGTIAGIVCDWISNIFNASAVVQAAQEQAESLCRQAVIAKCRNQFSTDKPFATGSTGVTPADMFRGSLFAYRMGRPMPLNVASMYVLLCGDQSQGFGIDPTQYNKILANVRAAGSKNVGIAKATQRKMWKLIKGIMYSAEPYGIRSDIRGIGDKGRVLFPILQDIVRNEYLRYMSTGVGGWNDALAHALSAYLVSSVKASASYSGSSEAGVHNVECDCAKPEVHLELASSLKDSVIQWQNQLQEKFFKNGKYVFGGQSKSGGTNKSGRLVMSRNSLERIARLSQVGRASTLPRTIFIGTGMATAGFLAWQGAKHLAKKSRGRRR